MASLCTWVSTGNAGAPNACAMTTLAVLWPTPGSASSSTKLAGTRPSCRSISAIDSPEIAFDFAAASPHGRTSSAISGIARRAIAAGVRARANRTGATRLTRASVHWADSTVATSSSYGSPRPSGGSGAG